MNDPQPEGHMASYIERRKFLATLGGAAAAWPLAARAQASPVRPLVGILSPLSAAAASRNIAAFRSALRNLGYVEGRNLTLAFHYGDGSAERMPSLARELVALNPDVVVAGATCNADDSDRCNCARQPSYRRVCAEHRRAWQKYNRNVDAWRRHVGR